MQKYFIVTESGKPIFTTHNDVVQCAIIPAIIAHQPEIQFIQSTTETKTFLYSSPIILMSEHDINCDTKQDLKILRQAIWMILGKQDLSVQFQQNPSIDFRNMLGFGEPLLKKLCHEFENNVLPDTSILPTLNSFSSEFEFSAFFKDSKVVCSKNTLNSEELKVLCELCSFCTDETWVPLSLFGATGFYFCYICPVSQYHLCLISSDKNGFERCQSARKRLNYTPKFLNLPMFKAIHLYFHCKKTKKCIEYGNKTVNITKMYKTLHFKLHSPYSLRMLWSETDLQYLAWNSAGFEVFGCYNINRDEAIKNANSFASFVQKNINF